MYDDAAGLQERLLFLLERLGEAAAAPHDAARVAAAVSEELGVCAAEIALHTRRKRRPADGPSPVPSLDRAPISDILTEEPLPPRPAAAPGPAAVADSYRLSCSPTNH